MMTEEDLNQLILFSFRLSSLMDVGTPILRALDSCAEAMTTDRMRKALGRVRESAALGDSLTVAFSEQPEVFGAFFVDMVRTGEERGTLDAALMKLSHALEREKSLFATHRESLERELPLKLVACFSRLRQEGCSGFRMERDIQEQHLLSSPSACGEDRELRELSRNWETFRRAILHLVCHDVTEEGEAVLAGTLVGDPPFFLRLVCLPWLGGEELDVTFHDGPLDPPGPDRLSANPDVMDRIREALDGQGDGILLLARDLADCQQAMAWILRRQAEERSCRCAWVVGSHWIPVRGITSIPPSVLLKTQGADPGENALSLMGYDLLGVGMPSRRIMRSLVGFRGTHLGLLVGRWSAGFDQGRDLPYTEGMLSIFVKEEGNRLRLSLC